MSRDNQVLLVMVKKMYLCHTVIGEIPEAAVYSLEIEKQPYTYDYNMVT